MTEILTISYGSTCLPDRVLRTKRRRLLVLNRQNSVLSRRRRRWEEEGGFSVFGLGIARESVLQLHFRRKKRVNL